MTTFPNRKKSAVYNTYTQFVAKGVLNNEPKYVWKCGKTLSETKLKLRRKQRNEIVKINTNLDAISKYKLQALLHDCVCFQLNELLPSLRKLFPNKRKLLEHSAKVSVLLLLTSFAKRSTCF